MNTTVNFEVNNNRMLLLSAVELAVHAYVHPISGDMFVFENPLNEELVKVHHVPHAKDKRTQQLMHDYIDLRKILLDDTEWRFNRRHAVELSVAIENYLHIFHGKLDEKSVAQLERLDRSLDVSGGRSV